MENIRSSICKWYRENKALIEAVMRAWYDGTLLAEDAAKFFDDLSEIFPVLRGLGDEIRERSSMSKILLVIAGIITMIIAGMCRREAKVSV